MPEALSACQRGTRPEALQLILQPRVSLAIWQRTLPPSVQRCMASMCALMPRQRSFPLAADEDAACALDQALTTFAPAKARAGTAAEHDAWRDDVLGLMMLARSLAPGAALRVRIETKANDGCRLFHVDHVALRLICTYRGAGTQWLPDAAVDRARLGSGSNGLVRDWSALREVSTGHVAVMKGLRFPRQGDLALVHRSPPTTPEFPRVVVVIDIDPS